MCTKAVLISLQTLLKSIDSHIFLTQLLRTLSQLKVDVISVPHFSGNFAHNHQLFMALLIFFFGVEECGFFSMQLQVETVVGQLFL